MKELGSINEAIEVLKNHTQHFIPTEDIHALNMAIKSLEAWNKVIEEIERQYQINRKVLHVDYYNVGIEQALEIINKYLGGNK